MRVGRAYLPGLGKAYAAAWEEGAKGLEAGQPLSAAVAAVGKAWERTGPSSSTGWRLPNSPRSSRNRRRTPTSPPRSVRRWRRPGGASRWASASNPLRSVGFGKVRPRVCPIARPTMPKEWAILDPRPTNRAILDPHSDPNPKGTHMNDESPYQPLCGWRGIDDLQRAFASQFPTLAQSAPHLMEGPAPTDPVLLYKAWRDVLGKDPAYPAAADRRLRLLRPRARQRPAPVHRDRPGRAGGLPGDGHRVHLRDVARGRRHPGPPGWLVRRGRGQGDDDDRDGQPRRCWAATAPIPAHRAKAWGLSGAPAAVKSEAGPFKLGSAALVSTWDELVAALRNGYPVTICTAQGFTLDRDADGFCKARGSWGHCMFIAGVRFDRPGACIIQSWGPDMPDRPDGPRSAELLVLGRPGGHRADPGRGG